MIKQTCSKCGTGFAELSTEFETTLVCRCSISSNPEPDYSDFTLDDEDYELWDTSMDLGDLIDSSSSDFSDIMDNYFFNKKKNEEK